MESRAGAPLSRCEKRAVRAGSSFLTIGSGIALLILSATLNHGSAAVMLCELVVGGIAVVCGILQLWKGVSRFRWIAGLSAVWLLVTPLLFRAPNFWDYQGCTLLGALLIIASFIVSGIPGHASAPGAVVPPGWSFNPSAYGHRTMIIILAIAAFLAANYLACFELGYLRSVWDPFFGSGTKAVLTSRISRAFPVPDAGLGAVVYLLDALVTGIGDQRRWCSAPWAVLLFALLVAPAGIAAIVLVILQPLVVGSWCTLCRFASGCMLGMVSLASYEVVACWQFLLSRRRAGKSLRRALFSGETLDGRQV